MSSSGLAGEKELEAAGIAGMAEIIIEQSRRARSEIESKSSIFLLLLVFLYSCYTFHRFSLL